MQAAFLQFSLNLCSYPQYSTWGGGGKQILQEISCFWLLFCQSLSGYEIGALRTGRHAIGKRLIALVEQAKVLVKNFSHGAPPKFFSGGSAARRLRLNLTSRHPLVLVKGAEGTCLPLTSARGCATPGCTNFLTGAFPARGEKAVYGPRAASGGAPTRHMPAPPARAEQGARGGRGRSAPTRARSDSGAAPSPRAAPALFAGASRGGLVPGRGARRPPSGRPFNAAHTLNGGLRGGKQSAAPPRATRLPSDGLGGTRSESRKRTAPGQRRASAPPRGRGRRRRGAARLMPGVVVQRGAVAPSAARRPGGRVAHALPRIVLRISLLRKIFRVGNDAACSVAAMHVAL